MWAAHFPAGDDRVRSARVKHGHCRVHVIRRWPLRRSVTTPGTEAREKALLSSRCTRTISKNTKSPPAGRVTSPHVCPGPPAPDRTPWLPSRRTGLLSWPRGPGRTDLHTGPFPVSSGPQPRRPRTNHRARAPTSQKDAQSVWQRWASGLSPFWGTGEGGQKRKMLT